MKIIIYEEEPSWLIIPIKTTMPFTPIKPTMPIPLNQKKAATHFAKCCRFRSRCKRGGISCLHRSFELKYNC